MVVLSGVRPAKVVRYAGRRLRSDSVATDLPAAESVTVALPCVPFDVASAGEPVKRTTLGYGFDLQALDVIQGALESVRRASGDVPERAAQSSRAYHAASDAKAADGVLIEKSI